MDEQFIPAQRETGSDVMMELLISLLVLEIHCYSTQGQGHLR